MRAWWKNRRRTGPSGLSCQEVVELVTDYLEGSLDPVSLIRFEEHIGNCDGCTTYLEQMKRTASLVGELREEHLSGAARARLLDAFRNWDRPDASG